MVARGEKMPLPKYPRKVRHPPRNPLVFWSNVSKRLACGCKLFLYIALGWHTSVRAMTVPEEVHNVYLETQLSCHTPLPSNWCSRG